MNSSNASKTTLACTLKSPFEERLVTSGILSLEGTCILLANAMALAVFLHRSFPIRKCKYLLVSLTVADLLVGLFSFLMAATFHVSLTKAFRTAIFMTSFPLNVSIFTSTTMAGERAYAILWPLRHRQLNAVHYYIAIAVTWCLSILIALCRAVSVWDNFYPMTFEHARLLAVLLTIPAVILTVACYIVIWLRTAVFKPALQEQNMFNKNCDLAKTCFMLTAVMLVTWLPKQIQNVVGKTDRMCQNLEPQQRLLSTSFLVLLLGNSLLNTLVYSFRMGDFRSGLRRLVTRGTRKLTHRKSRACNLPTELVDEREKTKKPFLISMETIPSDTGIDTYF